MSAWIERIFEWMLWNSRFLVVIAVVASVILAVVMFFIASADVVNVLQDAQHYINPGLSESARADLYALTVANVARIVDGYLFAIRPVTSAAREPRRRTGAAPRPGAGPRVRS